MTVGVNLGTNKNELISLSDEIDRMYITAGSTVFGGESGGLGLQGTPTRSEPGQPLGQFYGYQTNGIFQTQAEADACGYTVNIGATPFNPRAGDLRYIDQNGDGRINTADQVYIGNPWPKLTHGLTLGTDWKRLIDIKAVFGGTYGNDILNCVQTFQHNFFADYTSSPKIFEVSYFGDNEVTDKPRNAFVNNTTRGGLDRNGNWTQISDYHVEKGSYIQLRSLSIGFTAPRSWTSALRLSSLKVTFSGENLGLLTKYSGLTPLVSPQNRNILTQGIETLSGRYPLSRLYSVGLNIDF